MDAEGLKRRVDYTSRGKGLTPERGSRTLGTKPSSNILPLETGLNLGAKGRPGFEPTNLGYLGTAHLVKPTRFQTCFNAFSSNDQLVALQDPLRRKKKEEKKNACDKVLDVHFGGDAFTWTSAQPSRLREAWAHWGTQHQVQRRAPELAALPLASERFLIGANLKFRLKVSKTPNKACGPVHVPKTRLTVRQ